MKSGPVTPFLPGVAVAAPLALCILPRQPGAAIVLVLIAALWRHALGAGASSFGAAGALALALYGGPLLRSAAAGGSWPDIVGLAAGVLLAAAVATFAAKARWSVAVVAVAAVLLAVRLLTARGGLDAALDPFFSPEAGLLYWNPVLWIGIFGLFCLPREHRASGTVGLTAVFVYAVVPPATMSSQLIAAAAPALLGAAIASALEALRRSARLHPLPWIAAGGGLLTLWNFLFMEQYHTDMIPRDDTVSMASVAANSAMLLTRAVGAPPTWPASWVFAARHHTQAYRYEPLALARARARQHEVDVVDLASPAADSMAVEGWSEPGPCGAARCRQILGRARLLIPVGQPASLDLGVRAAGQGSLGIAVNGAAVAAVPLARESAEGRVRIAAGHWRAGLNEVAFVLPPGSAGAVEQLTLRRIGAEQ